VKRHELLNHLRRNSCHLVREGSNHFIYGNPATGARVPVPRHAEIDNRLAVENLQAVGYSSDSVENSFQLLFIAWFTLMAACFARGSERACGL